MRGQLIPHFEKQERYALPPLALLVPLAKGQVDAEMRPVIHMADELRAGYGQMLAEHAAIRQTADRLRDAAERAGKPEHVEFAEAPVLHARNEEEVLYPAAILVGEYLRTQLGMAAARR